MRKELIIDTDYGFVFGLDPDNGQQLIYLGGVKFKIVNGTMEKTVESADSVRKATEYINRSTVHMGM